MNGDIVNREYMDLVLDNQERYIEDYHTTLDRVNNSKARYKGEPIPTIYHPYFLTQENMDDFHRIGNMMISIANKMTYRYIEDKEFRKKFGFPKLIEDLIEVDNGYDINVPMGRFDIFYKDGNNFKFCELNTDGSSAMNEDNTIAKILLESKALKDFEENYDLDYFELFDTWVEESIEIFKTYSKDNKKPNVAIVDFTESGTTPEFEEFKDAYIKKGYNCIIADPRDLEYRDGNLYHKDYRIDLVYRRIVTFELIDKAHEIPDFIEAYKARAFCCIGSIRSQVIHNKIFFKILHDEDTLQYLSKEEREFVKNHIPYTGIFGGDQEAFNMVLNDKDRYIMKPMDLNASQGVYAGRDFTQEQWEEKLRESWNQDYLYQEYFVPFSRKFIIFEDGRFTAHEFKTLTGLYMYNERITGVYTRIGQNSIISGLTDYYTLPSILVTK